MTETQAMQLIQQHGATFVTQKDGIDWWRLPDKTWLAKRAAGHGMVELRKLPADACGC